MGAPQFTPGPWEAIKGVEQSDDMRCGVAAVRGDTRYLVATIENGAPEDFCDTEFANARLIAAAPELFEGLERAFIFICHNMPLGPTNDRTEAGKLIDSLRVPLASARPDAEQVSA